MSRISYDNFPCPECGKGIFFDDETEKFGCESGHTFTGLKDGKLVSEVPAVSLAGISAAAEDLPGTVPYQGISREAVVGVDPALPGSERTAAVEIVDGKIVNQSELPTKEAYKAEISSAMDQAEGRPAPNVAKLEAIVEAENRNANVPTGGDHYIVLRIPDNYVSGLRAMAEMQLVPFNEWVQREFERCLENQWFGS